MFRRGTRWSVKTGSGQTQSNNRMKMRSHHVSQFLSGHVCGIFSCRLPAYTPAMCSTPWTVGPLEPTKNASLFEFSYVCPEPVLVKWSFLVSHDAKDAFSYLAACTTRSRAGPQAEGRSHGEPSCRQPGRPLQIQMRPSKSGAMLSSTAAARCEAYG